MVSRVPSTSARPEERRASARRAQRSGLGCRLLVLLLASGLAGAAHAGALEDGQAAFDAMDYTSAATSLAAAASDPALSTAQRAHALMLLGMVRLTLGEQDLAQQHFVDAVTLDPTLEVPPDLSPKVRAIIEQARGQVAQKADATPATPATPASTTAPADAPATTSTPAVATSATPPTPVEDESASVWTSPWLWGSVAVVAVAAAVVGTIAVVLALSGGEPPPDETEDSCDAPDGSGCVKVTF